MDGPGWAVTGIGTCPQCGADAWKALPSSRLRRFGRWLNQGSRGTATQVRCGRCGHSSDIGTIGFLVGPRFRLPRLGWLGLPYAAVQVLRQRRSAIPAPKIYVGAALLGVAPSSDFAGDMLMRVDPARSRARRRRLEEAAFRNPPFPLYGLPSRGLGPRSPP